MVLVEFFGMYRLNYHIKTIELEADSVKDLFQKIHDINPYYSVKELRHSIVIVNDVNINELKRYRTPLKDGDHVLIMSPASGG